jgi:DNA-binding GntR family transcriptional regulator
MLKTNLAHRIDAIQNTAEVIAQSLKEMIYEAELKPGQPLIQERIAEMFEVSRVPVRDALQLLIGMGIAVNVPRRGVIVRPLSRRLLAELFEIRKILEGAAIRRAIRNAAPAHLRRLDGLIKQQSECLGGGDVKRYTKLDDEFHQTLYDLVDNARLVELILANWEMIKQARCASTAMPAHGKAWIATSIQRHKRVLAALKHGDAEAACATIFDNIDSSEREITACLREMGWIENSGEADGTPGKPQRARGGAVVPPGSRIERRSARRVNSRTGGA